MAIHGMGLRCTPSHQLHRALARKVNLSAHSARSIVGKSLPEPIALTLQLKGKWQKLGLVQSEGLD